MKARWCRLGAGVALICSGCGSHPASAVIQSTAVTASTPAAAAPSTHSAAVASVSSAPSSAAASTSVSTSASLPVPPPPDLAAFVPAGYTVSARAQADLDPAAQSSALIVTSHGPGLGADTAAYGGTEDVQVLTYDRVVGRWNLAFDARDKVVPDGFAASDAFGYTTQAVLPQADPITKATAQVITFAAGEPSVLISASDGEGADASVELIAALRVRTGVATLEYFEATANLTSPAVSGPADRQVASMTGQDVTAVDAAAYPVRSYTKTLGYQSGAVTVIGDDRPALGLTVATNPGEGADPAATTRIIAITPTGPAATAGLRLGDVLLDLTPTVGHLHAQLSGPVIVDELALHHAGDRISLRVLRGSTPLTIAVRTRSVAAVERSLQDPPTPAVIGIGAEDASSGGGGSGVTVATVTAGSPAAAAGLSPNDVIIEVGAMPVTNVDSMVDALMGTSGVPTPITVLDLNGLRRTVEITPTDPTGTDSEPRAYRL